MPKAIDNFDLKNYNDDFVRNLYNEDFHNYHIKWFRAKNKNFSQIILNLYKERVESVVDIGCSIGTFLEPWNEDGKIVRGYEYCYEESMNGIKNAGLEDYILFGDATKSIQFDRKYDLAVSIEVAEHIPTEYSEQFVKNLINASNGMVLLTAALPGQGGTGHINCQPKEFWINLFEKHGWKRNCNDESHIRSHCNPTSKAGVEEEFPYVWKHVYDNLMIFKKDMDRN